MHTRIHATARCALMFFALFAATFVMALLVGPVAHLSHWVESAGYAAGVSLTALLLDVLLNLSGKRPLFPSMLLKPGLSDVGQAGDEQAWAVLNHRRELLAERLRIDTSCTCARSPAPCDAWPFCTEARTAIPMSGMTSDDPIAPGCWLVENGDRTNSTDTEGTHHEVD